MNNKIISPVALLLVIGVMPRIGLADAGLLRTSYPLDDARGYCIDKNFKRESPERLTFFGWYGMFSGVTDLMCAPLNAVERRREGAF
ncbi:MAG: hypothetical protein VCC36_10860 [Gammaproteobacteria bacterium]|jgi:hypothetical protein